MEKRGSNMKLKVVEVCKISPSKSITSQLSLNLSVFDWLYLTSPQNGRIFFYPLPLTNSFFHSILIPKLKHSLSLTLNHFLPLAGTLLWPHNSPLPFILYAPNDAVSFVVAETDSDFDRVSGSHARMLKDYSPSSLVPKIIPSSETAVPLMAVQVTKFPKNGFSIGLATHRVVFDGKSSNIFLKSWAHICKMINMGATQFCLQPEFSPSFERGANLLLQNPFGPKNRTLKLSSPRSPPPSNWLRGTFHLTPTNIQTLEKRVSQWMEKTSSQQFYLSKFVVVYAYVSVCLIKAKQEECSEKIYMSFHADARWLLDPPVSSNYIGNCVTYPAVLVEAREFREDDGLPNIAKKISNLIVELRRSRAINVCDHNYEPFSSSNSSNDLLGGVEVCFNVDSPKSRFYETDFGWGRPNKIDVVLEECNSFSLLDSRDHGGGGVEVGLLLPTHQFHIFASLFSKALN